MHGFYVSRRTNIFITILGRTPQGVNRPTQGWYHGFVPHSKHEEEFLGALCHLVQRVPCVLWPGAESWQHRRRHLRKHRVVW